MSFEQTGFDYVIVDDAHGYKNLETELNIQNAAIEGSSTGRPGRTSPKRPPAQGPNEGGASLGCLHQELSV